MSKKKRKQIITVIFALSTVIMLLFVWIVQLYANRDLQDQEIRHLKSSQNVVVMQMDESCYTQFTNNYDHALYIKMKFDGKE